MNPINPEAQEALKLLQSETAGYLIGTMPNGHVRFEIWMNGTCIAFIELVPEEADKVSGLMKKAAEIARKSIDN